MANLAIDAVKAMTYDAIVIGSGISGGWAAKELTGKGLKTLVLERGRDVKHGEDYPTANLNPWEVEHRGQVPLSVRAEYGKSRSFMREETLHWAIKPDEQPFVE
jgi:choline dehydrogenase-like flavoprotein